MYGSHKNVPRVLANNVPVLLGRMFAIKLGRFWPLFLQIFFLYPPPLLDSLSI
jgi:hypothetical protein